MHERSRTKPLAESEGDPMKHIYDTHVNVGQREDEMGDILPGSTSCEPLACTPTAAKPIVRTTRCALLAAGGHLPPLTEREAHRQRLTAALTDAGLLAKGTDRRDSEASACFGIALYPTRSLSRMSFQHRSPDPQLQSKTAIRGRDGANRSLRLMATAFGAKAR